MFVGCCLLVGLLGVVAFYFSGAYDTMMRWRAYERALSDAWVAVAKYGRGGTVAEKQTASSVIRRRMAQKGKRHAGPALAMSVWSYRLKQVRKDSPDPRHPDGPLTKDERAVLEVTNEPLREEEVKTAKSLAQTALHIDDSTERRKALERIVGMGEAGLPGLPGFMQDSDSATARYAAGRFLAGIRVIEDDREVAALAKLGMLAATDAERLNDIAVNLVMCADQRVAVLAVLDVIENGTQEQVAVAKETYGNITGEEWTGKAPAEAWIRENCEQEDDEAAWSETAAETVQKETKAKSNRRKDKKKREEE